jgi:AcrR family transcriptional regulator
MSSSPGGEDGGDNGTVARYHRELLLAAMMDESASFGYRETTIARVAARAGVSRSEFYRQFAGKEECFLATFDELTQRAFSRVALASGTLSPTGGDATARARAGIAMLVEVTGVRPEASKLCLVQARGAGARAGARLDGALELFEQALIYQEAEASRRQGVSMTMVTGIVGGIYRVIYERLRSGRERELSGLAEEIVQWMLLYDNPGQTPRRGGKTARKKRATASAGAQEEGVGTRAASAGATPSRRVRLARPGSSRRERLTAYDTGIQILMGVAEQSLRDAPDWPAGVRGALAAITQLLGGDPALLELLTVEIFALGRDGRERDARSLAGFAALLAPGEALAGHEAPSPLVSELVAGGIWEILRRHAVRGQGPQLPQRTGALDYLALAPFIGRDAAVRAG